MFLIGVFHRLLRSHILRLSCYGGHAGCTQNITNLFQPWIQDPMSVQSSLLALYHKLNVLFMGI